MRTDTEPLACAACMYLEATTLATKKMFTVSITNHMRSLQPTSLIYYKVAVPTYNRGPQNGSTYYTIQRA